MLIVRTMHCHHTTAGTQVKGKGRAPRNAPRPVVGDYHGRQCLPGWPCSTSLRQYVRPRHTRIGGSARLGEYGRLPGNRTGQTGYRQPCSRCMSGAYNASALHCAILSRSECQHNGAKVHRDNAPTTMAGRSKRSGRRQRPNSLLLPVTLVFAHHRGPCSCTKVVLSAKT